MEKRRYVAKLSGKLRDEWNEFVEKKQTFDEWMEAEVRDLEERIRERGRPIEALHMMLWNHIYELYELDPTDTFTVTNEGEIYEIEPTHSLIEAIQTYGTIDPSLTVDSPFGEADQPREIWEAPSSDDIN